MEEPPYQKTPGIQALRCDLRRGDLASVLHEASSEHAEFVFGDLIIGLTEDPSGVEITFERGRTRHFDLVVGAYGLRSFVPPRLRP